MLLRHNLQPHCHTEVNYTTNVNFKTSLPSTIIITFLKSYLHQQDIKDNSSCRKLCVPVGTGTSTSGALGVQTLENFKSQHCQHTETCRVGTMSRRPYSGAPDTSSTEGGKKKGRKRNIRKENKKRKIKNKIKKIRYYNNLHIKDCCVKSKMTPQEIESARG